MMNSMSLALTQPRRAGAGGGGGGLLSTKRVLFIGDSTMAGRGSGTGAAFMDGARALSMPTKTAAKLVADGYPAFAQSSIGEANNGVLTNLPLYDPRILVTGTALATASEGPSLGGVVIRFTSTTTVDFTPTADVDTCEIYDLTNATYGTMRLLVNGVAATPDMNLATGPGVFNRYTYTFTKGQPVLRLTGVSGTVRRVAMVCYDSTAPCFITMNASAREWATADFQVATNACSPFNAAAAYVGAGDLIIANIGINDNRLSVSAATYQSNLEALVDKYKASGAGVILQIPTPIATDAGGVTEVQMASIIASVSTAKGLPTPINSPAATGTWASMVSAGETVDTYHITAAPYLRVAEQLIAPAIKSYYGLA